MCHRNEVSLTPFPRDLQCPPMCEPLSATASAAAAATVSATAITASRCSSAWKCLVPSRPIDRQQEERSAISEYRGGLEERLDEGRKEGGDKEGERREEETEKSMRTLTISVNLFFDV